MGPIPEASTPSRPSRNVDLEKVGLTDEIRNEARLWSLVDFAGRTELQDAALIHNRDAVGHGEGFFLVVGDIEKCRANLSIELLQLELHRLA